MNESNDARLARLEENEKTLFRRLDEQREELKNLTRLTVAVEKVATRTEAIEGKLDGIESRLGSVEKAPAKKWERFKEIILTAAITGAIGTLFGSVITILLK